MLITHVIWQRLQVCSDIFFNTYPLVRNQPMITRDYFRQKKVKAMIDLTILALHSQAVR